MKKSLSEMTSSDKTPEQPKKKGFGAFTEVEEIKHKLISIFYANIMCSLQHLVMEVK